MKLQYLCIILLLHACHVMPLMSASSTYYGSEYSKYPVLKSLNSGHISFEFKTSFGHGLLLYVDDLGEGGQVGDFFKLHLHQGRLQITIQIQRPDGTYWPKRTSMGHRLDDNLQHYVEVKREGKDTTIKLDGYMKVFASPTKALRLHSDVFIAGSPSGLRPSRDTWFSSEKK